MDLGLDGRVALLTGATSGIGLACARVLLEEGARVVVTGPRAARVEEAAGSLAEDPERVLGTVLDLSRPEDPEQAVEAVRQALQTAPTLLVSSTGGPPSGDFDDLEDAGWERALDLVLRGFIRTVRAVLPGMREAGHGRIVAISSGAAREPIRGLMTSSCLRAGLSGLVNALSREVGPEGITVNAVLPGYVDTDRVRELAARWAKDSGRIPDEVVASFVEQTPLGRLVEPAEVGAAVAFLCSAGAGPINGSAIAVDGGRLRSI